MSRLDPDKQARLMIRKPLVSDVEAIRELINDSAELGKMLFRPAAELYEHLRDFHVYEQDGRVVGCCALHVYWKDLAEVKSLAVESQLRGKGIGKTLVRAALEEAGRLGVGRVFALTLETKFFENLGFERVDFDALPLKVWTDCVKCPRKDCCDETALIYSLSQDVSTT
ncbi:MAG: N-acetyltransferase [Sedimentisphaerales bacterium]|nr:N-acetyltransferase [Sedimentisphaerales bacterium]